MNRGRIYWEGGLKVCCRWVTVIPPCSPCFHVRRLSWPTGCKHSGIDLILCGGVFERDGVSDGGGGVMSDS